MRIVLLGLMLCLTPALAFADAKPTPDEVKRVLDYFYHGKGMGPVLLETKICRDVQREGDEKSECAGDITAQAVKKGESVYLWMAYMVPSGDEPQNIIVQFENGGVTRMVKNLQVSGQLRNRTWLKVTLDKVGSWKVKIVHDTGSNAITLGARDGTVEERYEKATASAVIHCPAGRAMDPQ
jgi:hypothetical protein